MTVAPLCVVADGNGPYLPTLNGLNIGPGDTTSIKLTTPSGVSQWFLEIAGTDELVSSPPTLSGVGSGNLVVSPTAVVTFTFPPAGTALLFQSTVTAPGVSLSTTFGLFSLTTGGYRVAATGMVREGSTTFGWTPIVNAAIRKIGLESTHTFSIAGGETQDAVAGSSTFCSPGGMGGSDCIVVAPSNPEDGDTFWAGDSANPGTCSPQTRIGITPQAGQVIEDPSNPGTYKSSTVYLTSQGSTVEYLWNATLNLWKIY